MGIGEKNNETTIPTPSSQTESPLTYTPLYYSQNEARYIRRKLISEYETENNCNLIILISEISEVSVTYFQELLCFLDDTKDLHVLLDSPGGDGEIAVRLLKMAQGSCKQLKVIVPNRAKSAATIFALGSHEVIMSDSSDLGPIDPQIFIPDRGFVSAHDIIAAVDSAIHGVAQNKDTYPLYAALLAGIDASIYQFAKSALDRTTELAKLALSSNPDRNNENITETHKKIEKTLIESTKFHGAIIDHKTATTAGIPIKYVKSQSNYWKKIWRLWTAYFSLGDLYNLSIYESAHASQIH